MWILLLLVFIVLVFGPSLWVRYTLKRYSFQRDDFPGTGGEFARHLLSRFELAATVEQSQEGKDHYDTRDQCVRLSPSYYNGKSLTAITVAAHEVGHAIQYGKQEKITRLRLRYLPVAHFLKKAGSFILFGWPVISAILHLPYAIPLHVLAVGVTGMASVLIYVVILPEEMDASFRKALPILIEGNYVQDTDIPAVRRILKACAYTYIASALINIIFVWRWLKR
ncbi:zinc metallopeptidase [Marinomonas sp. 15G1-11]|uniref:Zinc metallopeptidase n=1 Tax=Marinomonas phaeophyticola TaxID=3004091 RepID=A0ABT4JU34_9GAMM|nr:zinc metallopeptidase [Marinomonas sp. 15G1-11]MCZ2721293.1 zinc metallopeptidase [Marinomonas sp. 15G1-11]